MPNYYTRFSFTLDLPDANAIEYALHLFKQVQRVYEKETQDLPEGLLEELPDELYEFADNWCFEVEDEGNCTLWFHSEDGGIDAVCTFVQHLLKKYVPTGHVGFEWSNDCDKPRVDAYGGGACLITATEIKSIYTGQMLIRWKNELGITQ